MIKKRVAEILKYYPETRGNDNELYTKYAEIYYPQNTVELDRIYICICSPMESFETIRRGRQMINAAGLYLPTETIQKKRKIREVLVRREVTGTSAETEVERQDREYQEKMTEQLNKEIGW